MPASAPERYRVVPVYQALVALLFLLVALLGAILVAVDPLLGLGLCVPTGAIGGLIAWHTWWDLTVIELGEEIGYWNRGKRVDIPRSAVVAVRVERNRMPLVPTEYFLVLEAGDKAARVLIALHLFEGARAMARARRIAEVLQVPLEDPGGDRARASRFALVRLVGTGHEWVAIPVALALLAALLLAGMLLS